jgi:hypothetical protein
MAGRTLYVAVCACQSHKKDDAGLRCRACRQEIALRAMTPTGDVETAYLELARVLRERERLIEAVRAHYLACENPDDFDTALYATTKTITDLGKEP